MAAVDQTDNTPEGVAYKLLHDIMLAEQKSLSAGPLKAGWTTADRAYLLRTYQACLLCVTNKNYSIEKV